MISSAAGNEGEATDAEAPRRGACGVDMGAGLARSRHARLLIPWNVRSQHVLLGQGRPSAASHSVHAVRTFPTTSYRFYYGAAIYDVSGAQRTR
jgi:hypothetical protein